ncbi:glucosyltransferase domain-containing protein [Vibrio cholerae]|uniref:glucosyltransferase domain-containing protein n=1 Tax=Vibrio cholerae TaxID=666 RepID=UPI001581E092|nr:glucosyltransferase domain-containing protein [Vibrio cholerae]QKU83267.1 hypothetical protein HPY07_12785 [Vibrio cholerae]
MCENNNAHTKNLLALLTLLVAPLVFYFYELSSFPMTYDELKRVSHSSTDLNWIKQGRWGMYYLSAFYSGNPVFPVVGIYLSLVVSGGVSCWIIIRSFKDLEIKFLILFILIYLSYPSMYFLYDFSTISFAIAPIYVLSLYSCIGLLSSSRLANLFGVISLVLALSLYQASISLVLLMLSIALYVDNSYFIRKVFLRLFIFIIISLIIYSISNNFFLSIFNASSSGYISNFVGFDFDFSYLGKLTFVFLSDTFKYYLFDNAIFLENNFTIVLLSFLGFLIVGYGCVIKHGLFYGFILLFGLIFSPFVLNLLSIEKIPTRSLIALPLAVSFFCISAIYWVANKNRLLSNALVFFACSAILYNFIALSKLMFISSSSWDKDKSIARMMISDTYRNKDFSHVYNRNEAIQTHLVGYLDDRENQYNREVENLGRSFFKWGANELLNIGALFNSLGFEEFKFADLEKIRPFLNEIRFMPSWPSFGYINFYGDKLVIKVSDYTESQWRLLCFDRNKYLLNIDACRVSFNPQSIPFLVGSPNLVESYFFDSNKDNYIKTLNVDFLGENNSTLVPRSNDSQLFLPPIVSEKDERLLLELTGSYSGEDFIDLYFKPNDIKEYTYYNVFRIYVTEGDLNIYVNLPASIFQNGLRVDPSINSFPINDFKIRVYNE